jgi:hypothetical protein
LPRSSFAKKLNPINAISYFLLASSSNDHGHDNVDPASVQRELSGAAATRAADALVQIARAHQPPRQVPAPSPPFLSEAHHQKALEGYRKAEEEASAAYEAALAGERKAAAAAKAAAVAAKLKADLAAAAKDRSADARRAAQEAQRWGAVQVELC